MLYVRVFKKEIRNEIKTSIINRSDESLEAGIFEALKLI